MTNVSAERLHTLLASLTELVHEADRRAAAEPERIAAIPPSGRTSATNLLHYLAVRSHDLRPLQAELHALSLSSLGRMEGHVRDTLLGVREALSARLGEPVCTGHDAAGIDAAAAAHRLDVTTAQLFGSHPQGRDAHVMVTLPSAAAADQALVHDLLVAGMDTARINLAHDTPQVWSAMVANVRAAAKQLGRSCRIVSDLPGPKLRTGAVEPGPEVLRVRPRRDVFGRCVQPAIVVFHEPGRAPTDLPAGAVAVPVGDPIAALAHPGDEIVVEDTRGRRRRCHVRAVRPGLAETTLERTAYLGSGCAVQLRRGITPLATGELGRLPALPGFVPLQVGDELWLRRDATAGRGAHDLPDGSHVPASIACSLPTVFDDAAPGQRILFDDGKIAGEIAANDGHRLRVRITATPPGGAKLRAEKGINLPDTDLQAPALDSADLVLLDWACAHVDAVALSFAQRPEDVLQLHAELHARGRGDLGVILKIETANGFRRLPDLLLAGMRQPPLGVMVARGDLAVEVGYERLAEVQEEILWLCEAAHVPVVWATQVLDGMARSGVPSRAEVTDAAMSGRAECVMLNKGPHIVAATRLLVGVLTRMQEHTHKKHSLLRRLRVAVWPANPGAGTVEA